jgi:hypothetical protein
MVTKGYQKGVYERVTKGIGAGYRWSGIHFELSTDAPYVHSGLSMNGLFGRRV